MSDQIVQIMDWAGILCILAGALLSFIAGIGLVRFPDLLSRMHAASKPQVLGLLLVLVGIGFRLLPAEATGIFSLGTLLLVGLFQVVTVPVAGHIVARVGYRTGRIRHDLVSTDELAERLATRRSAPDTSEDTVS
ncbi:monovalent cation/H(+) antiporter subunit G [Nocardiopsis listeri]|uniref:monovalent cation/H(+) antiporter subunit G n=1 Tax=Nocardiopsis listeri TaxID=53440 RepID=UPI000836D8E3|nr:monovalent cation/H(+) antiporter subunit G [Nocardiopsis listeri]